MGDRIAVMNDGVLEQVGTPEELYERPANRFVAGFIGSPAMSVLRRRGGVARTAACGCAASRSTCCCRARSSCRRRGHGRRAARRHARLWDGDAGLVGPAARARVEYVEALGRETFVGVAVGGARLAVFVEGRSRARGRRRRRVRPRPVGAALLRPGRRRPLTSVV